MRDPYDYGHPDYGKEEDEMSIRLSEKHGLNPSMQKCFVCSKDIGVLLLGRLPGDAVAPSSMCLDHAPCEECQGHMEQGVILISVDESKTETPANPWRTGGWVVVSDDYIKRVIQPEELAQKILELRMAFVPDVVWDFMGLPRGEQDEHDDGREAP